MINVLNSKIVAADERLTAEAVRASGPKVYLKFPCV